MIPLPISNQRHVCLRIKCGEVERWGSQEFRPASTLTMLPSSLRSIYQQYKADTDSVATWLATTAKANGYAEDEPASGTKDNPPASSGRLKGKARKKQQQQQNQPQPTNSAPKKVHILRIRDFEPMASFVAGIESLQVPDYLAVALERVIWGRLEKGTISKHKAD